MADINLNDLLEKKQADSQNAVSRFIVDYDYV